jgi:glycolate oxidase FAD binding subunit
MAPDLSDLQAAVREATRIRARGARTKCAPVHHDGTHVLDLTAFSGVIEYHPTEFVITAWAGTPVAELQALLAEHRQYLPFDPLLTERGATLGGTVAANACGPERYRYGGVRDFLIGARFIDGNGALIQGGGKVVKNAAGFDYPKLMVGSLGTLGVLVDLTFKVFPKPEAYATLRIAYPSLRQALALLPKLTNCPYDLNAIDILIAPGDERATLYIRVGGLAAGLPQRMARVRDLCGDGEFMAEADEAAFWRAAREFTWLAPGECAVKVPLTPARIPELDVHLRDNQRRYSVGGNVAWIATNDVMRLDAILKSLGLAGLVLINAEGDPRIGRWQRNAFAERVARALDPMGKFQP